MDDRGAALAVTGERLRAWREGQGLTQTEAAKRIHATQSAWTAWESGRKAPDLHFAHQLETLTRRKIRTEEWAVPRSTVRGADESGEQPAVHDAADSSTGS